MDSKSKPKFEIGEKVQVTYTDGIGHSSPLFGTIRNGPLGENEPYWYVNMGGVAVLFPEKDIQHAKG
jgi:hypothetical protein